jgi:hypothetical protein
LPSGSRRRISTAVIESMRPVFRALAQTFVPEMASLDDGDWAETEAIVEAFLAARPEKVRRQLVLLVRLLQLLPVLRWGRPFTALDAARRTRFLAAVQDAPLLLLRRGVWGLRSLAFMGFYGRAAAAAAIGYRADKRGWEAR